MIQSAAWHTWTKARAKELQCSGMSRGQARRFAEWDAGQRIKIARTIGDEAAMGAGLWAEPQPDGSIRMRLVLDLESVPLDRRAAAAGACSDIFSDWPANGEVPTRQTH